MLMQIVILAGIVLAIVAAGRLLAYVAGNDILNWLGDVAAIWGPAAFAMFVVVERDMGPTVDAWILIIGFFVTTIMGLTSHAWKREGRHDR